MAQEMHIRWGGFLADVTADGYLQIVSQDGGSAVHISLEQAHALLLFLELAIQSTEEGPRWSGE